MYTAAVLTPQSSDLLQSKFEEKINPKLLGFIFETKYGQKLPHHVTINLGTFDESLNALDILRSPIKIWTHKFLYNENICCAVVDKIETKSGVSINCRNEFPHITTCLRPPTRPFESNELFTNAASAINIDELVLDAFIEEIE